MKDWYYDEFKHVGVDYSNNENTDIYDEQMESFRNYKEEVEQFVKKLNIKDSTNLTVIDIGCGTGAFTIHASEYFKTIYAVDVSKQMLKIASFKAEKKGINNIKFINSGFLSFQPEEKADIVFSKWAFHHLPDFWKQAALLNMNKMLKPGGKLLLTDFIFKFDENYDKNIDGLLNNLSKDMEKDFVEETKIHIKDEYSTFDWILTGMIERAGFEVEKLNTEDIIQSEFLCKKIKSL